MFVAGEFGAHLQYLLYWIVDVLHVNDAAWAVGHGCLEIQHEAVARCLDVSDLSVDSEEEPMIQFGSDDWLANNLVENFVVGFHEILEIWWNDSRAGMDKDHEAPCLVV